jgi:hypothetical protein
MVTKAGNYNEIYENSNSTNLSKKDARQQDNKALKEEKRNAELELKEEARTPKLENIYEGEKLFDNKNPMRKAPKKEPQAKADNSKEEAALQAVKNEKAATTIQKFGKNIIAKNKELLAKEEAALQADNKATLKQIATEASQVVISRENQKQIKLAAEREKQLLAEKEAALQAAKLAAEKEEQSKKKEPTKGKAINAYLANLNKGKENNPNMTTALNQAQKSANSLASSGTKEATKEVINTGMSVKDRMKAFQR